MELEMNQSTTGKKINKWLASVDWLELVYLVLFTAFVMKKYLESTALEWELPSWYDTVVRGGIHAYILVRIYEQAVVKKSMKWKEIALMAVMIFTGEMVTLYTGEIFISDTLLFIIGAKGVDFKKICFVYLCIAISIQLVALYLVNGGYVPDYTYGSGDRVRHSLGICYPTDFAAHILFIFMVYICFRGHKLTFFEISLMLVGAFWVYKYTHARNDTVCILGVCFLCIIIKLLGLKDIYITKYKKTELLSLLIIFLFVGCMGITVIYNKDNEFMRNLNQVFSDRLNIGLKGYRQYGLHLFGSRVVEYGLGAGRIVASGFYFFLDSSYVRILIKYGYVFALVLIITFNYIFLKARRTENDYILAVLLIMLLFGISEHHLFELSFNPIWLLAFAKMTCGNSFGDRRIR